MSRFQILTLDGGGIKGAFIAALLADIEKRFGVKITDHFDLIVGTSTGGIIGLGLGIGLSAQSILEFYLRNGDSIFSSILPGWMKRVPGGALLDPKIYSSIFRRKFSNKPLEQALRRALGEDTLLGESNSRLVVPSYDLQRNAVKLFKTAHHERFRSDYLVPAWQVALATSAAPTFFRAVKANDRFFVDGGLWANNPIMVGITEAIGVLRKNPEDIHVLSIGALDEVSALSRSKLWGGKAFWAKPVVNSMMDGQSTAALGQASLLLGKNKILRVSSTVPADHYRLDDASCMDELIGLASGESEHRSPEIESVFLNHTAPPFVPCHEVSQ